MKIVKLLKESGLSIKDVSKTIKNEAKEQKDEFLGMLLCTFGASLLGNVLKSKGKIELLIVQLDQVMIFNAASFFN